MRSKILTAGLVLALIATLGGVAAADARPGGRPTLTDPHPCPGQPGFTCSTLTVPLDHTGRVPGTLDLSVATADNVTAPKGVLLFLTGGPGQGGVGIISRVAGLRLPEVAKDYRFVTLDQRGTGAGALRCPALQAQVGSSDIATPTPDAVTECARILGDTAPLYSTDQSVADFDRLRQALGVPKMVVDGVSYGSFTAARYAITHPRNVSKVVLDSVLPHHATASNSLYLTGLTAEARVLREACSVAPACGFDPAEDLAWVVRHRGAADGVKIFDAIVAYEFNDPTYRSPAAGDIIGALHAARGGSPDWLDEVVTAYTTEEGVDPANYSSGLHVATLCADQRFPWGTSATPVALRQPALSLVERTLPAQATWPYTTAVATHQGFVQGCLPWPAERVGSNPATRLPDVPVLLLNGDRDLSTPLEWAREEAAQAPRGRLVIVPGESHSIQNRERGHAGRDAVISFLE
jgi:pimeloyl-ACP methyl ester carboxylesterase